MDKTNLFIIGVAVAGTAIIAYFVWQKLNPPSPTLKFTLTVDAPNPVIGGTVTFSGKLTDINDVPYQAQAVIVQTLYEAWYDILTLNTNATGEFTGTYIVQTGGQRVFRATTVIKGVPFTTDIITVQIS